MSISVFSAQRFYAVATGSPLDRSQAVVTADTAIPQRGMLQLVPDPQGEVENAWTHGIAALGGQRERFILETRQGKIPSPITAFDGNEPCPHVRYHSLESLHASERTLASLLQHTEPLIAAAKMSRWAKCPNCDHPVQVFHTSRELCDHILHTVGGRDIKIELMGPFEQISPWAVEKGFSAPATSKGPTFVRIDSFTCSGEGLQKVETILASTKQLPQTWITVTQGNERHEYGWNGRCARCDLTLIPFNLSAARDYIERPCSSRQSHEPCRIIDGVSLSELLSLPLTQAMSGASFKELFSPLQQELISILSLEHLRLTTLTTDLAPQHVAALALLDLARDGDNPGTLRLFTAPSSLFPDNVLSSVCARIDKLSTHSGFVWITDDALGVPYRPPQALKMGIARSIARVTVATQPAVRVEARMGQWSEIDVPLPLQHLRVGARVYNTLSGKPDPLIAVESESLFTPHFIPLFPSEPSSTRLIAHAFGVIDPLTKMFAASHQAKMLGLNARDFLLGQIRQSIHVCGSCKGVGILTTKERSYVRAEPCHSCWGARFRSPTREITFKGRTMWEILNAPLSASQDTLRALPKMKEVFELATLLNVAHLPVGMPISLLSTPQRRRVAIAHAMLSGSKTRPSLIVVEEPSVGLSDEQRRGLESAIAHPAFTERVSWIGVSGT